ncbi:hypothetical protein GGR52DRAFT_299037 [Hypoxylon sp. FL1284]|nr:hypothetical protein GGR52DRAFT_299037 [Hypoxylon sp. FL1284]
MANGYLCGLCGARPRPAPASNGDQGLQGVEFSPRSSYASSRASIQVPASARPPASATSATPASVLDNPELAGYYSPAAPMASPASDGSRDLRGYYAPEPMENPRPGLFPSYA